MRRHPPRRSFAERLLLALPLLFLLSPRQLLELKVPTEAAYDDGALESRADGDVRGSKSNCEKKRIRMKRNGRQS